MGKAFGGEGKVASNIKKILINLKAERKRLLDEQEQLRASGLPSEGRREGSPYGKREEEASESFELEKRLALAWQIEEQLVDIENTLSKIAAGKYGLCESCGKPIESVRLKVLPQARACISCKGHHKGHFYSTKQVT
jgi:DnaK suppressor protein